MQTSIITALNGLDIIRISGQLPSYVTGISQDSRLIKPGYVFAMRSGGSVKGLDFIQNAASAGAVAAMTSEPVPPDLPLPTIQVREFHPALVMLSHRLFRNPSQHLKLIGITGTDAKTSTVHILRSIIKATGKGCGIITTIGYDTGCNWHEAHLTTPDIDRICGLLDEMNTTLKPGYAAMEVSSHALSLNRVDGLHFSAAGFTLLSSEHMDFHQSLGDYASAKSKLFAMLPPESPALINIDDPWSAVMVRACKGCVITYGRETSQADVRFSTIDKSFQGGRFKIRIQDRAEFEVSTSLIGEFQGYNISLATGITSALGIDPEFVVKGVSDLKFIPGRMELIDAGQDFHVLVDYSHTAHAVENAINTVRRLKPKKVIIVFGCGGNRDRSKRPVMGRIAAELADLVIITNDNPRLEKSESIIEEIRAGIPTVKMQKVMVEPDRYRAIQLAAGHARPGDALIIAGKGAETYQEINGVRENFDDRIVTREILSQM